MKIDERRKAVLECLVDRPNHDWSVSELAREAGVSQPTVSRIITELADEHIVETTQKGNMKQVQIVREDYVSDVLRALSDKYEYLLDAAQQFADAVAKIEAVEQCLLFGSVARGTADFESDVDVLVLVTDESVREKILLKAETISERTGFHISPTILLKDMYEEHKADGTQFAQSVERDNVILYDKKSS